MYISDGVTVKNQEKARGVPIDELVSDTHNTVVTAEVRYVWNSKAELHW